MCRPEESVYLEHGVQQKQSIYEGLVLKTQGPESVSGGPAALAPTAVLCPVLSSPDGQGTAPRLSSI